MTFDDAESWYCVHRAFYRDALRYMQDNEDAIISNRMKMDEMLVVMIWNLQNNA
jgi:hypothetical protein